LEFWQELFTGLKFGGLTMLKRVSILLILLLSLSMLGCADDRTLIIPLNSDNFIYGSTHGENVGSIIISIQGQYYNLTNLQGGLSNGFNFNETGSAELKPLTSGTYLLNSGLSFNSGANTVFSTGVAINGVLNTDCQRLINLGSVGGIGSISIPSCIIELNSGDKLTLQMANINNTDDIFIYQASLTALRLGD